MIRIGTSGWSYDHWTDVLYPAGLPVSKRLAHYVDAFDTVELNASFYRWPRDTAFTGWRERLPDGFMMAIKAHRGLTHFRRLKSPEPWVERFERCWQALGDRAEALLVQLHPAMERDDARLDHFLGLMPRSIPVAAELRHSSWNDPEVFSLLEPVCREPPAIWSTSGCTDPRRPRSTPAPTQTMSCASGPTA